MSKDRYWAERTLKLAGQRIERARAAMEAKLASPVLRRPNTSTLIEGIVSGEAPIPANGRDMMEKFVMDRYGDMGPAVMERLGPHLMQDEPEPIPEEGVR